MCRLRELQLGVRAAVLGGDEGSILQAILDDGPGAAARLRIHRNHLFTTLTEALAATYPVVCRLVHERFFAYAAHEYVRANPPRSPCLSDYGETFALFLAAFPPCAGLPYLADVARLEWALASALQAERLAPLDPAGLARVAVADMPEITFRLQPSLRLVASRWPVDRIWRANQPGADAAAVDLAAGGASLEIRQSGEGVAVRPLDPAGFAFRAALAAGRRLERATAAALARDRLFDVALALRALLGEGLLVAFALPPYLRKESLP